MSNKPIKYKAYEYTGDSLVYSIIEVDEILEDKDKEIAELKQKLDEKESWVKMLGEGEAALSLELEKTKQKLENVQASMYADVVDANMEVRRLKRALYIVLARSFCYMRELAARNALYDDECKWDNFKTTCLKKAEEYK